VPLESIEPQEAGQEAPERLQRTETSGCPALETEAVNFCVAPSSTLDTGGATVTEMSLWMVVCAEADLVVSAWLVALTATVAGAGTLGGAT